MAFGRREDAPVTGAPHSIAPTPGTAVVVGMSGSTGLAVVRALAAHGVVCHAVHHDGATQPMATRLAVTAVCPDWRRDPGALADFLLALAAHLREESEAGRSDGGRAGGASDVGGTSPTDGTSGAAIASLFVCDDSALQAVWAADGRLRAAGLRPAFSAARPPAELLDKRVQLEAAERAGVSAPWSRWGAADALLAVAAECPYPVIVKPAFSHLGVSVLGAKALRCASEDELRSALERAQDIEVLIQEFIPGGDDQLYTAGVFVCEGGHVAFLGRKLKQHPPTLGIARLAETADVPELVPGSVALLKELGYEGISQVEYKRDARDGSFQLIEANYRPWTWVGLATACGVNLPLAAHRWALWGEMPEGAAAPAHRGRGTARPRRWVWAVPEAKYALSDLRRGVPPRLSDWRGLRAEAFFSRVDPAPFLRPFTRRVGRGAQSGSAGPTSAGQVSLPRRVLTGAATVAAAAALWGEWLRAGRRTVTGGKPVVGLPAEGKVLVLAPHPDDETIMCGATLAALRRRGDPVRVLCVSTGAATAVRPSGDDGIDIGAVRTRELRAACSALGVDDLVVLDFPDGGLAAAREALAKRIGADLEAGAPDLIVTPFVHDGHGDHVAVALALADALAGRLAPGVAEAAPVTMPAAVLCGQVQTPLAPDWATRLVPATATWGARRAAAAAYVSRGPSIFSAAALLARLQPARPLLPTEAFVELTPAAYVTVSQSVEAEGLTAREERGRGHALAARLLRARDSRERISALLRAAGTGGGPRP